MKLNFITIVVQNILNYYSVFFFFFEFPKSECFGKKLFAHDVLIYEVFRIKLVPAELFIIQILNSFVCH